MDPRARRRFLATAAFLLTASLCRAAPARVSISRWTHCDGVTDDAVGVASAFAAAANNALTLVVDCPVFIHVGMDIARPIFVDDATAVDFSTAGLFLVDNAEIPSFVIVNSTGVTFTNWRVEYVGALPISDATGGYYNNGVWVPDAGSAPPAGKFNDLILTPWLTAHRGIIFHQTTSLWGGPTNSSAIFYIKGATADLTVTNMSLFVPPTSGVERFIPMCFSFLSGQVSNQVVTNLTPVAPPAYVQPSRLTFTNIDIDGLYMGWQGTVQDFTATHVRAHRYGDLQDANNGNLGGVNRWFAPPHLFYLNYSTALPNMNIAISDVIDYGDRYGLARDTIPASLSGNALSLKIGGINSTVDHYESHRPDGFLDFLNCDHLTISNATVTYNSLFLNNIWGAVRFPSGGGEISAGLQNITITDVATATVKTPLLGNRTATNANVVFQNVTVNVNRYAGADLGLDELNTGLMSGAGDDILVRYNIQNGSSGPVSIQNGEHGGINWTFTADPSTLQTGEVLTLHWRVNNAASCTAAGDWSGALANIDSRRIPLSTPGTYHYTLDCSAAGGTSTSTLAVTVVGARPVPSAPRNFKTR